MNKAIEGARARGRTAAERGKPRSANPYGDGRTHNGSVTFARAFWRAWDAGWVAAFEDEGKAGDRGDNECRSHDMSGR